MLSVRNLLSVLNKEQNSRKLCLSFKSKFMFGKCKHFQGFQGNSDTVLLMECMKLCPHRKIKKIIRHIDKNLDFQ